MSYETLMKIASCLALAAIICRFIPTNYGIAVAVSRTLHVGMTYRVFVPASLLILAGVISAIGLYINVHELTSPLRIDNVR